MSEQDVTLELSYLDRMSAGLGDEGPELVLEIVDLVLTDTPDRIAQLASSLDAGDLAGAGAVAHGLIGRCGLVGALRLTALCRRLEEDALRGDLAAGLGARAAIVSEYERLAAALRAARPSFEPPPSTG
jgi:HPt (histidine-containing phosphotransfer) domain-containing protein